MTHELEPFGSQHPEHTAVHPSSTQPTASLDEQVEQALVLAQPLLAKTAFSEQLLRETLEAQQLSRQVRDVKRHWIEHGVVVEHRRQLHPTQHLDQREGVARIKGTGAAEVFGRHEDGAVWVAGLSPKAARAVLNGDRVSAWILPPGPDGFRDDASLIDVLDRPFPMVLARATRTERGELGWSQERRQEARWIDVPATAQPKEEGDLALLRVLDTGLLGRAAPAQLTQRLGNARDQGIETKIAQWLNGIAQGFSGEAREQALAARLPRAAEEPMREDWRSTPFYTIDGESSKDFDDAIWAQEASQGGWRIVVAIADVGHYVQEGSALDQAAREKMTSVYLPHSVEPMLPEELSNGLCSLNPGEERLALCCEVLLDADGHSQKERFFKAFIRSAERLTYTQASIFIDSSGTNEAGIATQSVRQSLLAASRAAKALSVQAQAQGRIDMGHPEMEIDLDVSTGKARAMVERPRDSASLLVEECMLLANGACARALSTLPGAVFRNHAEPEGPMREELAEILRAEGVLKGDALNNASIAQWVLEAKKSPQFQNLRSEFLSRFKPASYESVNQGHFSLGMGAYTHFTSPIRRYADLAAHRLLARIISGATFEQGNEELDALDELSKKANTRSRAAKEAEVEARKLLTLEYAQRRIREEGAHWDARVVSAGERGIWTQIERLGIETMIPARALSGIDWNAKQRRWMTADGQVVQSGDVLKAYVKSVNFSARRLEVDANPVPKMAPDSTHVRANRPKPAAESRVKRFAAVEEEVDLRPDEPLTVRRTVKKVPQVCALLRPRPKM